MLRTCSVLSLLAVVLLGPAIVLAGEPSVPLAQSGASADTKTVAAPPSDVPRAYLVAVRIVSAKENSNASKKPRAPQVTRVVDRRRAP